MKAMGVMAIVAALTACSGEAGRSGARDTSRDVGANAAGSVITPAAFTTATSYLGIRYDSLPAAFTFESGALLPKSAGATNASFDLDRIRTPRGEMVWLDSIVPVPGSARPARIVRAELKVPPLAADERLMLGSCDVNGRIDPRVVAIVVVQSDSMHFTSIRQAWRADAASGQFEVISVTDVTCSEPG
jgi:hypothetical protein